MLFGWRSLILSGLALDPRAVRVQHDQGHTHRQ